MNAPAPGGNRERAAVVDTRFIYTAVLLETPAHPLFVVRREPLSGIDRHRALRELLLRACHYHGFDCCACHEEAGQ